MTGIEKMKELKGDDILKRMLKSPPDHQSKQSKEKTVERPAQYSKTVKRVEE